jgi:hypothetical protein
MADDRHELTDFSEDDTKRPAGPRRSSTSYVSGSRRDAAEVVAYVASR